MRARIRDRPPTPIPSDVRSFRALELRAAGGSAAEAARVVAEQLHGRGLLAISVDDACARFRGLLRDRDGDGRLELDLDDAALDGVIDLPSLEVSAIGAQMQLELTVDLQALVRLNPITVSKSEVQDVISGFMPLVLDNETHRIRPFDGQLAPHESMIEKVHFSVSDKTVTLRVLELREEGGESKTPKVLFRFPDSYKSYKEEGPLSTPQERVSLADATTLVKQLVADANSNESARLTEALALLEGASQNGAFASSALTAEIDATLEEAFAATPSKAWLGRQALDLISMPSSQPLLEQVDALSTAVPPELVFGTMMAEGFNIHWATQASWKGLPEEGPVFGMYHLGLDLLGRTDALAAQYETAANRDMNLVPPPPPKGPPTLDYPTAPTFDALVKVGLLPVDFPFDVEGAKNLAEAQGDRMVYDITFPTVSDAISAVHATLAFCQERFIRDYDHAYGAGSHEKLSEREMSFAISSYYNGGWILGRRLALAELAPSRHRSFGAENVDRSTNRSIETNAMTRVGLFDLLKRVRAFSP